MPSAMSRRAPSARSTSSAMTCGAGVRDRAAVVATAVLQELRSVLRCCGHADFAGARAAIEALLRDEFADVARTTLSEIRCEDDG